MEFYSYLWLREDGTPLYVGKGTGKRAYVRGSHHLRPPKDKSLILIFPQDSEAEAIQSEKDLIALFGRKDLGTGILRNFTDGGDGVSGLKHTEDAKRRMSVGHKGRPSWNKGISPSEKTRAIWSAQRKGKNTGSRSEETCRKISEGLKGQQHRLGYKTPVETKRKISQAHLGMKATEETKKKISEGHKGIIPSDASRKKLSESIKESWVLRRQQGKTNNTGHKHSAESKQKMKVAAQMREEKKRKQNGQLQFSSERQYVDHDSGTC